MQRRRRLQSERPPTFDLHNCLLAGNLADTQGNVGGGHFNRDNGRTEMINCTIVKNVAVGNYGGAANLDAGSDLIVQNCIIWGNDDGPGNGGIDNQLAYLSDDPETNEVDQNVIEFCTLACFTVGTNKNDDPDAVNSIASPTWTNMTYDGDTGITTFDVSSVSALDNESLFQPDADSPLQLLIESVNTGDGEINCYGKWVDLNQGNSKTGTIYDYHIASGSSAIDFGDATYYPLDDCELDPEHNTLEVDLDLVARTGNPDSGAYEDN